MVSQKIAAVTGGNKGIGLSIVRALCKQFDGDVYLTARDEGRGKQAVKELEKEGLHPKFQILDISNVKSVDDFKNFLIKEYGGIDVFVHMLELHTLQKIQLHHTNKQKLPFLSTTRVR